MVEVKNSRLTKDFTPKFIKCTSVFQFEGLKIYQFSIFSRNVISLPYTGYDTKVLTRKGMLKEVHVRTSIFRRPFSFPGTVKYRKSGIVPKLVVICSWEHLQTDLQNCCVEKYLKRDQIQLYIMHFFIPHHKSITTYRS